MADVAVVEAFELGVLGLPDFYFTGDDYRYRLETDSKRRFLDLLRERFKAGVRHNGRTLKWDTAIEQKATELGRVLVNRTSALDFSEPSPRLVRHDVSLKASNCFKSSSKTTRFPLPMNGFLSDKRLHSSYN
jgi:hypothetical protein